MEDGPAVGPALPLARVKKIAKCDKDVKSISQNSTVMMAKAAELFITKLAKDSFERTQTGKRKVVKVDDVVDTIENEDYLSFLTDHISILAPNLGQKPAGKKQTQQTLV